MNIFRQSGFGLLLASLVFAYVPGRAETGEQIAKSGNAAGAPACVACHGMAGQGQGAVGFPRLAGMNADYLESQLHGFQNGTRANPIMGPIAKLLSPVDAKALAAYYAALPPLDTNGGAAAIDAAIAAGRTLALNGDWKNGVPACSQCHGVSGLGVGAAFPPISGQPAVYTLNQLQAWKAGTRKNDPMGLMRGIALKLSAADVDAVAAYYAGLPSSSGSKENTKP